MVFIGNNKLLQVLILVILCLNHVRSKICHHEKNPISSKTEQQALLEKALFKCFEHEDTAVNDTFCPKTWDGVMCWPTTEPGTIKSQRCPGYVHRFKENGFATRECMENGEWFVHPLFNKTWTNYTGCVSNATDKSPVPDIILEHLPRIQLFYNVGYGISLASLLIAVVMMVYFRKLHCQRNTVHINMFLSFILRAIICFVKDVDITPEVYNSHGTESAFGQAWICRMVYAIFFYMLTANFMWIFIEGLFLHTFVMSTKYNVSKKLYRTFLILGWCLPFFVVLPWVLVRLKYENTLCWNTMDNHYFWIIKGPIMLTSIVNLIFFINIIRVLYTKLSASNMKDPKKFRKLARSTLVLIPLFGVYYVVFIAVPVCMDVEMEIIWMYSEMFFNSFQGFAVALLFCFLNGEVQREVIKLWHRKRKMRRKSNTSCRSRTTIHTHQTSVPEIWDVNGQGRKIDNLDVNGEGYKNYVVGFHRNNDIDLKAYPGDELEADEHSPMVIS